MPSRYTKIQVEDTRPVARPGAMYGENPHYNDDGTFNGHTVLVVTGAGRLIDPTIQQFAQVPDSKQAMLTPAGAAARTGGPGNKPDRGATGNHIVLYMPLPGHLRQAWRGAGAISRDADFRRAGANLAANTLAMFQIEGIRDTAVQAPYARLRRLLAALNGMGAVADGTGFRFADPTTGREIWLSDVL